MTALNKCPENGPIQQGTPHDFFPASSKNKVMIAVSGKWGWTGYRIRIQLLIHMEEREWESLFVEPRCQKLPWHPFGEPQKLQA